MTPSSNKTSDSITGTMSGYGFSVGSGGDDNGDRLVNWQRSDSYLNQAWNLSLVGDRTSITENSSTQIRTHGPTFELVLVARANKDSWQRFSFLSNCTRQL
jgi:hypothetical protein